MTRPLARRAVYPITPAATSGKRKDASVTSLALRIYTRLRRLRGSMWWALPAMPVRKLRSAVVDQSAGVGCRAVVASGHIGLAGGGQRFEGPDARRQHRLVGRVNYHRSMGRRDHGDRVGAWRAAHPVFARASSIMPKADPARPSLARIHWRSQRRMARQHLRARTNGLARNSLCTRLAPRARASPFIVLCRCPDPPDGLLRPI